MPEIDAVASPVGASMEEAQFGAWSARPFRGPKLAGPVLAATRCHEDYLQIASLDPEVEAIAEAEPDVLGPLGRGAPDYRVTDGRGDCLVHVLDGPLDAEAKAGLADAFAAAGRLGLRYDVIDSAWVGREPRLRNARLVFGCRKTRVSPGDRVRILQFLAEAGTSTLQEAAAVVAGSPEGVECVLALAIEGTVWVDLRRTLGPEMPVRRLRVPSDDEDE